MRQVTIPALLEQRFSQPRFAPYLAAAGGSPDAAVDLYRWNVAASGAVYEALHLVEVIVRNAIHGELETWHAKQGRPGSWLENPPAVLTQTSRTDLLTASDRARKAIAARCYRQRISTPPPPTPGDIVAQLNFGFWRYLVATRYTHDLWHDAIRHAFPNESDLRTVERPLARLHQLRNRIAHLEPIHDENLLARRRDMIQVVGHVDRRLQSWFASVERIQPVVQGRP